MRLSCFKRTALLLALAATCALGAGRELKISADKLDYDENRLKIRLLGHVKIVSQDMTMTAPFAEYFTDRQVGHFEGGVKITGPGTSAVGREMKVFYGETRAVLLGSVRLVSDKVAGGEGATTPTTMACDRLDYNWITGVGKAQGGVKVRQGNRRAFADTAEYHRLEQYVVLDGNVRFERGQEDWLSARRARMDLVAETVTAEGGVVARTRLQEDKPKPGASPEAMTAPTIVEPTFPLKPVDADPPIPLPGL